MAFCGKCGASLDEGKFCPNCGAPVEPKNNEAAFTTASRPSRKAELWKKVVLGVAVFAVVIFAVTRFTSMPDEPCDWCGNSPPVAYKMSDDTYSYVCKDCGKKCAWCGEKATKHYENLVHMMIFVCDDCYEWLQ